MATVANSVQGMLSSTFSGITEDAGNGINPSPSGRIAFAVYSADDDSLNFYKRDYLPSEGSTFHGRTVTEVYLDFEHQPFYKDTGVTDHIPTQAWADVAKTVKSVEVVDSGICPDSLSYWFYCFESMQTCNVSKLDTSKCTKMDWTWLYCTNLSAIDIRGLNTSNVTSMGGIFDCTGLQQIDVSGWNVSQVTNFSCMFAFNYKLTSIKGLSSWDVSNGQCFGTMFRGSDRLKSLPGIENWNVSNGRDFAYMFTSMTRLSSLDLSGWSVSSSSRGTDMFLGLNNLDSFTCGNGWMWMSNAKLPGSDWKDTLTGQTFAPSDIPNGPGMYRRIS